MRNILEKIDICKLGGIDKQKLPLWVYSIFILRGSEK